MTILKRGRKNDEIRALLMLCAIGSPVGAGEINANAAQSRTKRFCRVDSTLTTDDELVGLYHGRSWLWTDGARYFSAKQRQFTA
ncbi:MAG: DUF995 domain-containing protein [Mesorhizobium sp.]|nr:MAG: DUF995 domain-containing protein [Mesorhizobium sp.]